MTGPDGPPSGDFAAARAVLRQARRVVVVTGAGVSAASGIATYRSAGSGWDDRRREEISRASRYGNHLAECWQGWGAMRAATAAADPNPAHFALAGWQERLAGAGGSLVLATQNVDGLHQRAGSTGVAELHGSMHRSRCMRCDRRTDDSAVPAPGTVPACDTCGGRLRPDVVLFEERLPSRVLRPVQQALGRCDVCLYVGTSGNVWPVSDLVSVAKAARAACVLVNAEPWDEPHPDFDLTVLGRAEIVLPGLLAAGPAGG